MYRERDIYTHVCIYIYIYICVLQGKVNGPRVLRDLPCHSYLTLQAPRSPAAAAAAAVASAAAAARPLCIYIYIYIYIYKKREREMIMIIIMMIMILYIYIYVIVVPASCNQEFAFCCPSSALSATSAKFTDWRMPLNYVVQDMIQLCDLLWKS